MKRACGECQLCCKLLPVAEGVKVNGKPMPGGFHKPAGQRCKHQRHHKGCAVYGQPGMPMSCRMWNCAWLVDERAGDLRRPDRAHYVIDILPDFITLAPNDGSPSTDVPVVQVWLDPDYPDAHRDPALRTYLAEHGERGIAALVRLDSSRAFTLLPPALSPTGDWLEHRSGSSTKQHSAIEIDEVMQRGELHAARPGQV